MFALLLARGLPPWIVIPVGFVLWVLVFGWLLHVGSAKFLGWLDVNLIAAQQRVLIRPAGSELPMQRLEFAPSRMLRSVSHRVHPVYDPV